MRYRTLGKTGFRVSELAVGAWQLGGPLLLDGKTDGHPDVGRDCAIDLIRRCGDLGINVIDTAEQYGAGESERRVGAALAGQRDRWILSTKFGAIVGPNGERIGDTTAKRISISLEGSLKRLQTDHIDIYLYHVAPDVSEAPEVAKFLDKMLRQGKVRAVGISTNNLQHIQFLHSLGICDVIQFAQSMISPQPDLATFIRNNHLGACVRGALAAGKLSGKYFHHAPEFPPDDIRSNWSKPGSTQAADYTKFAAFEKLTTPQRTMPQLAIRYLLDQPTTHTIILGAKKFEEYEQAAKACDLAPLTKEELTQIDTIKRLALA